MGANVEKYLESIDQVAKKSPIQLKRLNLISNLDRQIPDKAKLPSYSACLKAEIQPKNFRLLRDYYELVVKDYQLAQMNKGALLSKSKPNLNNTLSYLHK